MIERGFPLRQASLDSVHEKSVRHGHISTLHIWPARRPLATCRAALIATLLPGPGDAAERARLLERLGAGALRVLQACTTPEAIPALLTLYESGPCSSCRERSVDLLLQLGSLPDHVLDEVPYDANLGLRAKGRALITGRDRAGPT